MGRRWKGNRRRMERAARGRCGKRQWRNIDDATRAVVQSLASPRNPVRAMSIYICRWCGWYHQSRSTTGDDVVRVIEREYTQQ